MLYSGGGAISESEAEDDPEVSRVTLPQGVTSRGNMSSEQSSVRLVELGPRMTMSLVKIEEGMYDGEVLYHKWVEKTDEEKRKIKIAREKRKKEKEKRKREQDQNVKKKEQIKEEHKQKSLEGMTKKKLQQMKDNGEEIPAQFQGETSENKNSTKAEDNDESEDDADEEWYRKEVGEEPEQDLFDGGNGRKRSSSNSNLDVRFKKRMKKSTDINSRSNSTKQGVGERKNNKASQMKNPSFSKGPNRGTKWKFNGTGSKESKRPKGDSFSKDKKDFKNGKRKPTKRVFNSEGVGPNYKKSSTGKRKSYDTARGSKSSKYRK